MTRGRARKRGGSKNVVLVTVAVVLFIRISVGVVGCCAVTMVMVMMCAKHVTKAASARLCFITL